ncbi:hypothetical protein NDU88_002161 [Pleurodeles waltl]|uniref:Uncharacterized protein n=1 Tax=Pleurodeles waltl TaxID=8319 RepID=A0AAV7M031_PLEWA|nr:hypothetical protein NDU88_002161 [Pleurodeles waltl]
MQILIGPHQGLPGGLPSAGLGSRFVSPSGAARGVPHLSRSFSRSHPLASGSPHLCPTQLTLRNSGPGRDHSHAGSQLLGLVSAALPLDLVVSTASPAPHLQDRTPGTREDVDFHRIN